MASILAIESCATYGTVKFEKSREGDAGNKPDTSPDEITSEGDVETGLPKTGTGNTETCKVIITEVDNGKYPGKGTGSGQQMRGPYHILAHVSSAEISTSVGLALTMHFLNLEFPGILEKAKFTYLPIVVAYVLQMVMGIILLRKLVEKIRKNCAMSSFLLAYHALSAVVAGLQVFVMVFPFLFGNDTDGADGFNPLIFSQAALLLCLRIPIFLVVEKVRKASKN